jgi:hypothetical protein
MKASRFSEEQITLQQLPVWSLFPRSRPVPAWQGGLSALDFPMSPHDTFAVPSRPTAYPDHYT